MIIIWAFSICLILLIQFADVPVFERHLNKFKCQELKGRALHKQHFHLAAIKIDSTYDWKYLRPYPLKDMYQFYSNGIRNMHITCSKRPGDLLSKCTFIVVVLVKLNFLYCILRNSYFWKIELPKADSRFERWPSKGYRLFWQWD